MKIDPSFIWTAFTQLLPSIPTTLAITAVSVSCGFIIGLIAALLRIYKVPVLGQIASGYVTFIRGTPMLTHLLLIYFGLPMLLGGQRVHDPDLEACLGKGTLDGGVVVSRPLDDHDLIPDPELLQSGAEVPDHGSEACLGVLNLGGWNENPAVEIGEHPLGPGLGAIDTDDA